MGCWCNSQMELYSWQWIVADPTINWYLIICFKIKNKKIQVSNIQDVYSFLQRMPFDTINPDTSASNQISKILKKAYP